MFMVKPSFGEKIPLILLTWVIQLLTLAVNEPKIAASAEMVAGFEYSDRFIFSVSYSSSRLVH